MRPEGGTIWESAEVGGVGCTRRAKKIVEQSMQTRGKARRGGSTIQPGSVKKKSASISERKPWNAAEASSATSIRKPKAKTPHKGPPPPPTSVSLGELKGSAFIGLLRLNTKPERFGFSPNSKSLTPTKKGAGATSVHEKENLHTNNVRVSYPAASRTKSAKKTTRVRQNTSATNSGGMRGKARPSKSSKPPRVTKCSASSGSSLASQRKRGARSSVKSKSVARVRTRTSMSIATTPTLSRSSSKVSTSIRIPQPSVSTVGAPRTADVNEVPVPNGAPRTADGGEVLTGAPHTDNGGEVPAFPTPEKNTSSKTVPISRVPKSDSRPTRSVFASADSPIPMPKVYLTPRSATSSRRASLDGNNVSTSNAETIVPTGDSSESTSTDTERKAVIQPSNDSGGARSRKIEVVFAPRCADTNYGGSVTMGTSPIQESEYSKLAEAGGKQDTKTTVRHSAGGETTTLLDQFDAEASETTTAAGDNSFNLFATQVSFYTDNVDDTHTSVSRVGKNVNSNEITTDDVGTDAVESPRQQRVVCYHCYRFVAIDKVIRVEVNNFCGEKCVDDHLRTTKVRCCALGCRKIFVGVDGVQHEVSKMWFCSREHLESTGAS